MYLYTYVTDILLGKNKLKKEEKAQDHIFSYSAKIKTLAIRLLRILRDFYLAITRATASPVFGLQF